MTDAIVEYRKWVETWNAIKYRNEHNDYSCGTAIIGMSCDYVVLFENEREKRNYLKKYGHND